MVGGIGVSRCFTVHEVPRNLAAGRSLGLVGLVGLGVVDDWTKKRLHIYNIGSYRRLVCVVSLVCAIYITYV